MSEKRIAKPDGYKSHMVIVDEGNTLLVCNVDYTQFQVTLTLGDDFTEFEVTEDGNEFIIKEIE